MINNIVMSFADFEEIELKLLHPSNISSFRQLQLILN